MGLVRTKGEDALKGLGRVSDKEHHSLNISPYHNMSAMSDNTISSTAM